MRKNYGFTFIETIIVVAIIAVLTTVILSSTTAARAKARDTKRVSDLKEIQLGLALYFDVNRSYPSNMDTLVTQKFLPSIPTDPNTLAYEYTASTNTYCLGTVLEVPSVIPSDNANCSTGGLANYTVKPSK